MDEPREDVVAELRLYFHPDAEILRRTIQAGGFLAVTGAPNGVMRVEAVIDGTVVGSWIHGRSLD